MNACEHNRRGSAADEEKPSSVFRRETIHRMVRRCLNWDYYGVGSYLITIVLNDRRSCALGRVVGEPAVFEPSALGNAVHKIALRIPEFTPEIELLGVQLMPDHVHLVLRVVRRLSKPLGERLRGFKMGCTRVANELAGVHERGVRGGGLFADGFVDTLLPDEAAIRSALAYLADNPRRLAEKRAHPELFQVLQDLACSLSLQGSLGTAHFAAIGNRYLLQQPTLLQVQCSRSVFRYALDDQDAPLKDRPPSVCTEEFLEQAEALLAAAEHGAVLVSPCISHGEQEIARRAFARGFNVIALKNKGFSPLYKPGGALFDVCAAGNLLLLAPAEWPFLPGKKPITRMNACALNRIAQLLSGSGAVELHYRGMLPRDVDADVVAALRWRATPG